MFALIILSHFIHLGLLKLAKKYAHIKMMRKLGMKIGEPEGIKLPSLRLFLESYLDISMAATLNAIAIFKNRDQIQSFF